MPSTNYYVYRQERGVKNFGKRSNVSIIKKVNRFRKIISPILGLITMHIVILRHCLTYCYRFYLPKESSQSILVLLLIYAIALPKQKSKNNNFIRCGLVLFLYKLYHQKAFGLNAEITPSKSNLGIFAFMGLFRCRSPPFVFHFLISKNLEMEDKGMSYNYARERRKFVEDWKQKRAEYMAAGMDVSAIEEMYRFDLEEFRRNRIYTTHTVPELPFGFDDDEDKDKSMFLNRFREIVTAYDNHTLNNRYGWVDDIDNPLLAKKIKELSINDIELLTLWVFDGFSQRDIGEMQMVSHQSVSKKIQRLKKFFEKI